MRHRHCNELPQKIRNITESLAILPGDREEQRNAIDELASLKNKTKSLQIYHDQLVNAVTDRKMAEIDFQPYSADLAVVGRLPWTRRSVVDAVVDKFKVRIPGDHKIELRGNFFYAKRSAGNELKSTPLPQGEYAINISRSQKNLDGQIALDVTIDIEDLEPISWIHKLDFFPDRIAGTKSFVGKQVLDSNATPLILFSSSYSSTAPSQQIDLSVSLIDVTNHEQANND